MKNSKHYIQDAILKWLSIIFGCIYFCLFKSYYNKTSPRCNCSWGTRQHKVSIHMKTINMQIIIIQEISYLKIDGALLTSFFELHYSLESFHTLISKAITLHQRMFFFFMYVRSCESFVYYKNTDRLCKSLVLMKEGGEKMVKMKRIVWRWSKVPGRVSKVVKVVSYVDDMNCPVLLENVVLWMIWIVQWLYWYFWRI